MKKILNKIHFFFWKWWIKKVNLTEDSIKKMGIEQLLYILANKPLEIFVLGLVVEKIIEQGSQENIDFLLDGDFFFSENAQRKIIARGRHDEIMKLLNKQFVHFKTNYSGKLLSEYVARYNHEEIMFLLTAYKFRWDDDVAYKIILRGDTEEIQALAKADISSFIICHIIDRGQIEEIACLCDKQSQTMVNMLFERKQKVELTVLVAINHHLDKIPNALKKLFAYGDDELIRFYAVKGGHFDAQYMRELLDKFTLAELDEAMRSLHPHNAAVKFMFKH